MQVELTINELLFIDDEITVFDPHSSEEIVTLRMTNANPATIGVHIETMRKIGGAILEALDRKENVKVDLEFYELLLIRELARSTKVVGGEQVGLDLKKKVYQALQHIEVEDMLPYELNSVNSQDIVALDKTTIQEKLIAFEDQQQNARNKNTRKNKTNNNPVSNS